MGRAMLIALALCLGCKHDAPPTHRDDEPPPTTPADDGAPRLRAEAATATFDAATRTLSLRGLAGVDVHDASGARVHTATPAELVAIHDQAMAKRADPTVQTNLSITGTDAAGRGFASAHELEGLRYDAASQTTTLVLRPSPRLAELAATMTRPSIVMGPVPLHVVCCDCDWACIAGWAFGYCATCISGTAGASSCCAVCGIPANSSQTCP